MTTAGGNPTKTPAGAASARMSSSTWAGTTNAVHLRAVVWVALAVRLAVFPFAENKHADAPMRALLAERMNADPDAWADPRSFCQFGPLPIEVMRPFLAIDPDARRSSRIPSLLAGLLVFLPFFAMARRMVANGPAVFVAGLALALSPLHVQLSTTAASEGLYLLLLVAAFERLHAALTDRRRRDFLTAGLLLSLAAVTRYDTWLVVPVAGATALIFGPRDRRASVDVGLFLSVAAILPAAYLAWSWRTTGDPFFFARYINRDHAAMAEQVTARLGGALARARQLGIWVLSFAVVMTPAAFLAAVAAARGWRRFTPATRVVLAAALAPPAAYIAKGLLFGNFEPLPRFALAPGVVVLPLAASALLSWCSGTGLGAVGGAGENTRRWRPRPVSLVAGGSFAITVVTMIVAFARPGRIWSGAESLGPLTRLDAEDRAVAKYLLAHRPAGEGVFIDTWGFADIIVAHAARVPAPRTATLSQTRTPASTLAESRRSTGASWFAVHDDSWGKLHISDWPADSQRFGHWRLAHVGDTRRP